MDTNRLRQFCAIAETGSMTKASELLHITHSGLSKSMKILQAELRCLLFRPSGRGLELTEDGILIYQRAKEFLRQEEQLFKLDKSVESNTLRIGTVEIFLFMMAEKLKQHPFSHHTITLLDLEPGSIEQMIINKQLDFGITYAPYPMDNIEITEIGKYRLGCYHVPGSFEQQTLFDIPFVVPMHGLTNNPLGIKERDGWLESVYPRNKKYYVNLLSTALELTLQGLCAIYIPDFIAKKVNATRKSNEALIEHALPKKQKNQQRAYILHDKRRPENNQCKQLHKMIKEIIA
jgi:DNA-binding transcriptional LysR family regulator